MRTNKTRRPDARRMPSAPSEKSDTCNNVRAASPTRSISPERDPAGRHGEGKSPASDPIVAPTAAGAAGPRIRAHASRLTKSTLRHAPSRRIRRTSKRWCSRSRNAGRRKSIWANSTRRPQEGRTPPRRTDVPHDASRDPAILLFRLPCQSSQTVRPAHLEVVHQR